MYKNSEPYNISPLGYLARAREQLKMDRKNTLFYAAFEIRCCVETRQLDYAESLQKLKGKKYRPWKIGDMSKALHSVWDEPKISEIIYNFEELGTFTTYYTPVTRHLVAQVERNLNSLLHARLNAKEMSRNWWLKQRRNVRETYRLAWVACKGEHMSPPLWNGVGKEMHPSVLYLTPRSQELIELIGSNQLKGRHFTLGIRYFDRPLSSWKCDI